MSASGIDIPSKSISSSSSSITRREREAQLVEKVSVAVSEIKKAKYVDQVILSLHSIAVLLFPLDSSLLAGVVDECYKDQILSTDIYSTEERDELWQAFYQGAAFPALARVLLFDISSNWLACFPFTAQKHVYDVFFTDGLAIEVVQTLIPCLNQSSTAGPEANAILSNIERLLVLFLVEHEGIYHLAKELGGSRCDHHNGQIKPVISRVAQLLASIPDKGQFRALSTLSAHNFFKQIVMQLLSGAERRDLYPVDEGGTINSSDMKGTMYFIGETFARICRRGFVDMLSSEISHHVRNILLSNSTSLAADLLESNPAFQFYLKLMENVNDSYAVERILEVLLQQLATEHADDVKAYWILWILFHKILDNQPSIRSLFVDKFLLWKVFPVCCLRWIFQFAVFRSPPNADQCSRDHDRRCPLDTVERLLSVWSKKDFIQSASLEQQAYVTAAIGLLLEKMSKEELDESKDAMHSILQGVSNRLENPDHLVRKMANSIAFVFSKAIDPKNPLVLDDTIAGETIDWEFGLMSSSNMRLSSKCQLKGIGGMNASSTSLAAMDYNPGNERLDSSLKDKKAKLPKSMVIDPDEIVDPATLNESSDDEYDDASEGTDDSTDSLQPYDLTDDDTDLKRRFSQLVDIVSALKKTDDADGVVQALGVAEKLARASPDELKHVAGDLVRTLVQVRCSDVAVEGEEDSAEEKRQKALVALLVSSPLESLDTIHKLLYSPNVDVSQRIMMLDIMTEAAQELAESKIMKPKHLVQPLISMASENGPWFLPTSAGPPGASMWKEVSGTGTLLNISNFTMDDVPNWSTHYERELPPRPGQPKKGKTRRWSIRSSNQWGNHMEVSQNKFPIYAAAFMLPAMQGFDKKRHGVDFLGRDFIVLGKLIHMLGVCMRCTSMHPEATALAPPLLDLLRSREVCQHTEAYVRRAVLFAASCLLMSLPPSYVASSLVEGNAELSEGLEWIRTWAIHVVESDSDRDCYTVRKTYFGPQMAMACLQLHAEMALQASRALEMADSGHKAKSVGLPSDLSKGIIKIPGPYMNY